MDEITTTMAQERPEVKEVSTETTELAAVAAAGIATQEQYDYAAKALQRLKVAMKKLDGVFDPLIKKAYDATEAIRDEKKKHYKPLEAIDEALRKLTGDWITEQERLKAVEEAKRLKAAKEEEERRKEAAKVENDFLAEVGLAEDVVPVPVAVAPVAAIAKGGLVFRTDWKWRVTSLKDVPEEYKILDEKKLNAVVKAMKDLTKIAGIETFPVKTTVV